MVTGPALHSFICFHSGRRTLVSVWSRPSCTFLSAVEETFPKRRLDSFRCINLDWKVNGGVTAARTECLRDTTHGNELAFDLS